MPPCDELLLELPEPEALPPRLDAPDCTHRGRTSGFRPVLRDPYLGREMWLVKGFEVLTDCRSIKFDAPDRKGKPRYRLVYRNEPEEGAIAVICVLAVGERNKMTAYKQARARLRGRLRSAE